MTDLSSAFIKHTGFYQGETVLSVWIEPLSWGVGVGGGGGGERKLEQQSDLNFQ